MNTVLAMADAEGVPVDSMYKVLYQLNQAGYILENLNPTNKGYYFVWDSKANKMYYVMSDLETVYYPEDITLDKSVCYITCGSEEEVTKISDAGFGVYLTKNMKDIHINNLVNIDTGVFSCNSITISAGASATGNITISGNVSGSVSIDAANANVSQGSGYIGSMTSNAASTSLSGNVGNYSSTGGTTTVTVEGQIDDLGNISGGATFENQGVVVENNSESQIAANITNITVTSSSMIENIRNQVNAGRDYKDIKIELGTDINVEGIQWTPVSNFWRNDTTVKSFFSGEFDGKGKTIYGLSNNGFSITELQAAFNDSTPETHDGKKCKEVCFALFGSVTDAYIHDIVLEGVDIDIQVVNDGDNIFLGDCVAGVVGYAYGNTKIESVTVKSGSIKGYDDVGGIVGMARGKSVQIINCKNYAKIESNRRAGGIIGQLGNFKNHTSEDPDYIIINCENYGDVTYGVRDNDPIAKEDSAYYQGGLIVGYYNTTSASNHVFDNIEKGTATGK